MKISKRIFRLPLLTTLLLFTFLVACEKDDGNDNNPTPVVKAPEVSTLVENFAGNGAVSVDNDGNVYVSEYGAYSEISFGGNGTRLFKISPDGIILETYDNLSGPMGTKKDSQGNLFINNDNNTERGIVLKIAPDGTREDFATIPGWPSSMAMNNNDKLFITNYAMPTIHTVDAQGNTEVLIEDSRLAGCVGIDFDSSGNLIVSNFFTADIYKITPNGELSLVASLPEVIVQGWGIGYCAVVDDFIYATGIANSKIYKISLDGQKELFAGTGEAISVDGELLEASFSNPNGIAADKTNKILYISEYQRGIRKINLD